MQKLYSYRPFIIYLVIASLIVGFEVSNDYLMPVDTPDRTSVNTLELTKIGAYGVLRKARPGVPAHYHTGIDIKRPSPNYRDEPIFPITEGIVISKRTDGPYAQLIIEHGQDKKFWTVYEHIAGIYVHVGEPVNTHTPIARFMNKSELDQYGWQFDHFHFEILKSKPIRLEHDDAHPDRHYASYTLVCYTIEELNAHFYDPFAFLSK
ncbi:MAG: M23 family metallopeptidase [Bacteroidota bacterium]